MYVYRSCSCTAGGAFHLRHWRAGVGKTRLHDEDVECDERLDVASRPKKAACEPPERDTTMSTWTIKHRNLVALLTFTDCPGEETHKEYGERSGRLHEGDEGCRGG